MERWDYSRDGDPYRVSYPHVTVRADEELRLALRQLYRDYAAERRRLWLIEQRRRQAELARRDALAAAARNRRRDFLQGRGRGRN